MDKKGILLAVADPQVLIDITQALGAAWEVTSAATEADAVAELEKGSFDTLLVDFNLGQPDGSELLNQALEKHPETMRFLLAYEADLALVAAKVLGPHQILPKPIEPASLKSRIENGVNDSAPDQSSTQPTTADAAPTIPSVYSEVLKALESQGVTNEQVGNIIARDSALTTELLGLTKSAYMGLPRNLTDPTAAVESLGLETVKALVLALKFLAEHSHLKPSYLSLGQLWQHSTKVAQIARDLVLFETRDRRLASQALVAGLVHDLGKVVLLTNFDDLYGRVHSLARKQPVALWDIEKEMFGANHGEIGGCLVGMWNLPASVVEAAAFHHEPPLGEHESLTPLAAVHIANVLEHELQPSGDCRVAPVINTAFLNELGLLDRLPVWHAAYAIRHPEKQQPQSKSAETEPSESTSLVLGTTLSSRIANHVRGLTAATRTATSGRLGEDSTEAIPAFGFLRRGWVYAAVAAGVLFSLALWLRTQTQIDEFAPVYARTPAVSPAPAVESSTPLPETAPPEAPLGAPDGAVSEETPAASASSLPTPEISQPAPVPTPAVVSQPTVTNAPPPSLPPKASAPPGFRLNGIIYTVAHPSAIVNGKMVYVGDRVSGATVIDISRTEVTLQIRGLRRTCGLREK